MAFGVCYAGVYELDQGVSAVKTRAAYASSGQVGDAINIILTPDAVVEPSPADEGQIPSDVDCINGFPGGPCLISQK